jgi:hypothetical protein
MSLTDNRPRLQELTSLGLDRSAVYPLICLSFPQLHKATSSTAFRKQATTTFFHVFKIAVPTRAMSTCRGIEKPGEEIGQSHASATLLSGERFFGTLRLGTTETVCTFGRRNLSVVQWLWGRLSL